MSRQAGVLVGVDVGGTFTDCVLIDVATETIQIGKVPSTTENQSIGVVTGIDQLLGGKSWNFDLLVHGTTVATNAVIERSGEALCLITTSGFRDVLELRRRDRPHLYGLHGSYNPLIPRDRVAEIRERTAATGAVEEPPAQDDLEAALGMIRRAGVTSVVVSFMNAYANPQNEHAAAAWLRHRAPEFHITCACDVSREQREFERTSTATVDAFLHRRMEAYLHALRDRAKERGFGHDIWVSQSNGGRMSLDVATASPVKTLLSGPAAGIVAGQHIARLAGYRNAVTMDMGGTSLDVGVLVDGTIAMVPERRIGFGIPVRLPMVDIQTIGAGGGSIAHIDLEGLLEVGPESAGAMPGPACYDRSGTRPTLTDANVLLGRLGEGQALGSASALRLHRHLAEQAVLESLGRLGGTPIELARSILDVAVRRMAASLRLATTERGLDPQHFALVSYGGAGPLHVCDVLKEVPFREAIVPLFPGITCALGCLIGEARHDFVQTVDASLSDLPPSTLPGIIDGHLVRGRELLEREGVDTEGCSALVEAEMRFQGQTHSIPVPLNLQDLSAAAIERAMEANYLRRFGRMFPGRTPILGSIRTTVIGPTLSVSLEALSARIARDRRSAWQTRPSHSRLLHSGSKSIDSPVYARDALPIGHSIPGPALIEQRDTTCFIDEGFHAIVDPHLNIRVAAEKRGQP
ncbi:MAG: hydantoinase/oxoprolinase family protein [Alphaproteobacteria bacterium]|nr:hydantoinase/oxoprolinase family protein [Alphaproteobacteria bacterium]